MFDDLDRRADLSAYSAELPVMQCQHWTDGSTTAIEVVNVKLCILVITSCARGDTICPRPSRLPWAPKRLARRRADAT